VEVGESGERERDWVRGGGGEGERRERRGGEEGERRGGGGGEEGERRERGGGEEEERIAYTHLVPEDHTEGVALVRPVTRKVGCVLHRQREPSECEGVLALLSLGTDLQQRSLCAYAPCLHEQQAFVFLPCFFITTGHFFLAPSDDFIRLPLYL
jgi:hypothetical protein